MRNGGRNRRLDLGKNVLRHAKSGLKLQVFEWARVHGPFSTMFSTGVENLGGETNSLRGPAVAARVATGDSRL
jgi:hypothetical protein